MPTKLNSAGEQQPYDAETGRFTETQNALSKGYTRNEVASMSMEELKDTNNPKEYKKFGESGISFDEEGEYIVDEEKYENELKAREEFFNDSIKSYESKYSQIDLKESIHIMQRYSENFYQVINGSLYKGEEPSSNTKRQIKSLDKTISNYELPENIMVYRCVDSNILDSMGISNVFDLKGKTINNKGYSSCSLDKSIMKGFVDENTRNTGNKQIIMRIGVPKGNGKCFPIWNYSDYKEEQEMLIKRDASFEITDVYEENGIYYIDGGMV